MNKLKNTKQYKNRRHLSILKITAWILVFLYFGFVTVFIIFNIFYADKILPNVTVNGIDIGGKTPEEAVNIISYEFSDLEPVSINIGEDYSADIKVEDIGYRVLYLETSKKAFGIGRDQGLLGYLSVILQLINNGIDLNLEYEYDELAFQNYLSLLKYDSLDVLREPKYELIEDEITIIEGKSGETFDELHLKELILTKLSDNTRDVIYVEVFNKEPSLTIEDLDILLPEIQQHLAYKYTLRYENESWDLTRDELLSILNPLKVNERLIIDINNDEVVDKLEVVATEIDRNPRGQVLEIQDGKAVQFVASQTGLRLKMKESADALKSGIINKETNIELAVEVTTPPPNDNEYGIEDVLGYGESRYRGSDSGRMANIKTATEKINGVLIPPDGNFSFNEAVGPIDKENGFKTAWVISKGRTVLGDGGGVCQVSTTVFRSALEAGLPIVERNAHSYRVSYYEQDSGPGVDATIYQPSADLVFKNDTGHSILLTTQVDQENAYLKYTLYGKSDGRTVEISEPKILSQTPPPAAVYEDDPSLPKGTTKQVEYPVWGAKVVFSRVVKRDNEILYDDTFTSNYRAWGAVYKVGTRE